MYAVVRRDGIAHADGDAVWGPLVVGAEGAFNDVGFDVLFKLGFGFRVGGR